MSRAIFVLRSYEPDDFAVVEALARDHGVTPSYVVGNASNQVRAEALGAFFQNSVSLRAGFLHDAYLPVTAPDATGQEPIVEGLEPAFLAGVEAVLARLTIVSGALGLTPRQHLLSAIAYWRRVLSDQLPAFVFFAETPHQVHDLALQIASDASGVPVRILRSTSIPGMQFASERIPCGLDGGMPHGLDEFRHDDVRAELRRLSSDYDRARPEFMDRHMANARSPESQALREGIAWLRERAALRAGGAPSNKAPCHGAGFVKGLGGPERRRSALSRAMGRTRTLVAQRALRNAYAAVIRPWQPRTNEAYVYVSLHFQPERTTAPEGGRWAEQAKVIETVVRHLPAGWRLVVKEHPLQLHAGLQGFLGRAPDWYRMVARLDSRVVFVNSGADPFTLIDGARGVVTVTGTAGWEALARGKPVLCSEGAWYSGFPRAECLTRPGGVERFFVTARSEPLGGFDTAIAAHLDGLTDRLFHSLLAVGNHMSVTGADRLGILLASWRDGEDAQRACTGRSGEASHAEPL